VIVTVALGEDRPRRERDGALVGAARRRARGDRDLVGGAFAPHDDGSKGLRARVLLALRGVQALVEQRDRAGDLAVVEAGEEIGLAEGGRAFGPDAT
jgi:hypothetical protein